MQSTMDLFAIEKFKTKHVSHYPLITEAYLPPAKNKKRRATFQAALKLTLVIGQCFGLNPVLGICELDAAKLRFSYLSWRSIYSLLSICAQSIFVTLCFLNIFGDGNTLTANGKLIFHGLNSAITILFFRIAMQWPRLCQLISRTEAADPILDGDSLIKKCNLWCVFILFLALLEHLLSIFSEIATAIDCSPNSALYQTFITNRFPWMYVYIPYSDFFGFISQLINTQCTFNWNFSNVFVICISFYLTSKLEQVNSRIKAVRGKKLPPSFWRSVREDYSRATYLVKRIDDVISGVIFVSFASNMFFICFQLLFTLEGGITATSHCNDGMDNRPWNGYEKPVYFVYSLAFLIFRSLTVSLVASDIHRASLKPAYSLYSVPSEEFCSERWDTQKYLAVNKKREPPAQQFLDNETFTDGPAIPLISFQIQRFIEQIHGDNIALTGLNFFSVKRGLILTIAGTIVTYELVLIQFSSSSEGLLVMQPNGTSTSP